MNTEEMVTMIDDISENIQLSCQLFELSKSSYYAFKSRCTSASERRRLELSEKIKTIYDASQQIYGAPKIHQELIKQGEKGGLKLVQKLMRAMDLKSIVEKKFKPSVPPQEAVHQTRDNLILKKGEPMKQDEVWTTDITYIQTQQDGWCYLSTIMDRFSRKVLAWDFGKTMTAELVISTFKKAVRARGQSLCTEKLMLHSDQGSQYTSADYEALLSEFQVAHSFSRKGYPYHNASQESWHGHLKREWLNRFEFKTFEEAKQAIFWYIEAFYNERRIHEYLNYHTPNQFERIQAA